MHRGVKDNPYPVPFGRWAVPIALALAFGLSLWAYAPGLDAPFLFDDLAAIKNNPSLRSLWPLGETLAAPPETPLAGRPVANLSFALNYAWGELNPRGYHVVNLALHDLNALLVFALTRRVLRSPRCRLRYAAAADWIATVLAALWLLHPMQSETVLYTVQRTESLMALFYLASLYCAARGAAGGRAWPWHVAAVASCALGMATKEVTVSAPLAIVLCDAVLYYPSFAAAIRSRWKLYIGLALTWTLLAASMLGGPRSASIGFEHGVSSLDYLRTQAGVIAHYLRLSVWPDALVISYDDWPIARRFADTLLPGLVLLLALGFSVAALTRRRPLGLFGVWFFLLLAPTSSFVPIATEIAAERRMYLPLLVPLALIVLALYRLAAWIGARGMPTTGRTMLGLAIASIPIAVAFTAMTHARAADYCDPVALWRDTLEKRPNNALARINLANALLARGDAELAIADYEKALELLTRELREIDLVRSKIAKTHYNLANALVASRRVADALPHYACAAELDPRDAEIQYNWAVALAGLGRDAEALAHYEQAVQRNERHVAALNNLGLLLGKLGRHDEALARFRRALEIQPDAYQIRRNLGDALLDLGRFSEAEAEYRRVLERRPEYADAHANLGVALAMQNRVADAIAELQTALRLDPRQTNARRLLAELQRRP